MTRVLNGFVRLLYTFSKEQAWNWKDVDARCKRAVSSVFLSDKGSTSVTIDAAQCCATRGPAGSAHPQPLNIDQMTLSPSNMKMIEPTRSGTKNIVEIDITT